MNYTNLKTFEDDYINTVIRLDKFLNAITQDNILSDETLNIVEELLRVLSSFEQDEMFLKFISKNRTNQIYQNIKLKEYASMGIIILHHIKNEFLNPNPNYTTIAICLKYLEKIFRQKKLAGILNRFLNVLYKFYNGYNEALIKEVGTIQISEKDLENFASEDTYVPEGLYRIPNELRTEIINLNRIQSELERHNPSGLGINNRL